MIVLDNVSKVTQFVDTKKFVLSHSTLTIPTNRSIALLGSDTETRGVLLGVLAGTIAPDSGAVIRHARCSFLVGTFPAYDRTHTLRANAEHVIRLYGAPVRQTSELVRRIADIGGRYDTPSKVTDKSGIKIVSEALALSIPFDVYLMNSEIGPKHPCWELFRERQRHAGFIIPTKSSKFAKEHCDMALFHFHGKLALYERVTDALTMMRTIESRIKKRNLHRAAK